MDSVNNECAPNSENYNLVVRDSVRAMLNKDGGVLLDIKRGVCYSINTVGAQLWGLVSRGCDLRGLSDYLTNSYGISRGEAERDVSLFLTALRANGLLVKK